MHKVLNRPDFYNRRYILEIQRLRLGMYQSNCYIVSEGKKALIVDPGDSGEEISEYLERNGLEPEMILLTHGHVDHVGGVDVLEEKYKCPVYISKADKESIDEGRQIFGHVSAPLKTYPENGELSFAGKKMEVLDTPGHTKGGVCLYFPEEGVLFSGDTLFKHNVGRYDLYGGDGVELLKGIREKLLVLPDDTVVYPGHDMETTIGHEKKYNMFLKEN